MKYQFLSAILLICAICQAQTNDDPVIMTVSGVPVLRSEFEYNYNKNNSEDVINKMTVEEYVELFIDYKLKVQAAIDAGLDKTESFENEFAPYREKTLQSTSIDEKEKRLLIQEYHDGLLLYEISNQMVWSKSNDNHQRNKLAELWEAELRTKYKYTINSSVLATVNNHSRPNNLNQDRLVTSNQPKAGIDLVDSGIPTTNRVNRNTFAIIVANENYSRETKVDYAKNDGGVFKKYCHETLGLPEKNVHFIPDATLNDLIGELDWIQQVCDAFAGDASVIFYYAGHGIPDEASGSAYLLPTDGNSRILRTCFSINELYDTLGKLPAKKVTVLMDACFSGAKRNGEMLASARGVAIKAKAGAPKGNMIVLSAAQGDETAYKYEDAKHGLFTYFLLKKLKDSKGDITMGELSQYLQDQVKRYSIVENGKSQTPCVQTSDALRDSWRSIRF